MTREGIEKIYSSLMKRYRRLRRWYARGVAKNIWTDRYYEHHIDTLFFLAFDRGKYEIESRRMEIRKWKWHFASRQAAMCCWKEPNSQKIEREVEEKFLEENKRLKENAEIIAAAEKWQKEKMLSKEEMKTKKKELFYMVETFDPVTNGKANKKSDSPIKKAMKALQDCDWKTFDAMFQYLKKVPRCELTFEKNESGIAKLRERVAWLDKIYEEDSRLRKPGAVMGMIPPFFVRKEWMLRNKEHIKETQERQAKEIAALDKVLTFYREIAKSDAPVAIERYLCTCRLSGTTHVENLAEKIRDFCATTQLTLKRDPKNEHDQNAIMVLNEKDERIGWIPQQDNELLARLMDAERFLYGKVKTIKPVTKTGYLELYFKVYLCDI